MKRVYHRYEKWEEYHAGMWRDVSKSERDDFLKKAIEFTGNAELYGSFMFRVINEWPISCEHNLTCLDMNRQAWIGHAACCLAIGCPENITREAWGCLTDKQQEDANAQAQGAIETWEDRYCGQEAFKLPAENRELHKGLGGPGI